MQHLQRRQHGTLTWGFNDLTGSTLPACGTFELFLNTTQLSGQDAPAAPYSFIAYPEGGLPSVYPLTLTGTTAPWTVTYPAGTRLMFNIADASGNSGGVPPEIYTVQSGTSSACLLSGTAAVTMKIDEPSALNTCTVLPIHIDGGQKPYTVTFATADSVAPSNKTLGTNDDTFEWLNQSAPNSQLIVAVSDSKGQYALASKIFTTSGSTDASCPGQSSRSYNSNGGSNNGYNGSNNSTNNNNGEYNGEKNEKNRVPMAAIIGGAVGAMVLLGLLLFIYFRRRNGARGGGGVGIWERKRYHKPSLDHSPERSQTLFPHHDTSQNHLQPSPFDLPGTESNAALSYYRDDPTPWTQNRSAQSPPLTAATVPAKYQQDQQQSFGQQSRFAYPPPQPPSTSHSTSTSTGQQPSSYYTDSMAHLVPQGTSATPRSSVYNDGASRNSRYTVQNPSSSQGGEAGASLKGGSVNTADRKAAEAQRERQDPPWSQPLPPAGSGVQVYQHEDAGGVIELPPAYREVSHTAPSS